MSKRAEFFGMIARQRNAMTQTTPQAWNMGNPHYVISTRVAGGDFDEVVTQVRAHLKENGFGVLTEIDFKKTMKVKMEKDIPRYLILGACNPPLAYEAVSSEPGVGVLLPCNVLVSEEESGIFVGAIDPVKMFSVVGRDEVEHLANAVKEKITKVINAVK